MNDTSRRTFLKSASALTVGVASATVVTGVAGCRLAAGDAPSVARADATSARETGFDRPLLDAVASVVLPASLGADARRAATEAFVAWADGYDPVAEEMHGYGYADVRYLPSDPSPAWRAQLDGLDVLARRTHGTAFTRLDSSTREAVITRALRDVRSDRMPTPLTASHVALALLAHWAASPAAWNLAFGADVSPSSCRPLGAATRKPLPIGPSRVVGGAA